MRQVGRYLPEYRALRSRYSMQEILQTPELAAEATWMPLRRFDVDAAILFSDLLVPLWGMGVEFDLVEGKGPVVRTSADRWANLPPMDLERVAFTFEAIHLLRRTLDRPLIGFTGAPFTVAAYLIEGQASRDWPRTRAFLHTHPEAWHALLRQLAAGLGAYLRAQVDAGVQMVQVFDSWVGVLSPVDFVRAVRPYVVAMLETVGAQVPRIYFTTGSAHLLPHFRMLPAEVIGLDWRTSLADAANTLGRRALQGNLDPTLLLGPRETLLDRADAVVAEGKGLAGHIFSLGHGVLPETDPDRVAELVEWVHERGAR